VSQATPSFDRGAGSTKPGHRAVPIRQQAVALKVRCAQIDLQREPFDVA